MTADMFVFNEPNYHFVFNSWGGPVGREIASRALSLEAKAITSSGLKTGALKASISTFFTYHGTELAARVGANPTGGLVGYALFHHEGTRPHTIRAKPGSNLRFASRGRVQFTPSVQHPGTKPNPYLTRWLREAV